MADRDILVGILDLARWAPSGDNTQPWRFEILGDCHVAVHGFDTRERVVYDFDGHASHIAHGALLETMRIAASGSGLAMEWRRRAECAEATPIYDVYLRREPSVIRDPLIPFIERRVVQRRPMRLKGLTPAQRQALASAPGHGYEVQFFESFGDRLAIAKLLWDNAYIRLTCPEAFQVHREVIEWGARHSKTKIPERAVGVDPLTGKLMRWAMKSWPRVDFLNRYLFGTIAPRVQLDFVPALSCAAHLFVHASQPPAVPADYVRAGIAMQRLWLTATSVGLHLQPEMTPVIFNWYTLAHRSISALPRIDACAARLAGRVAQLAGVERADGLVFMCRVGSSATPKSRSTRQDLSQLMLTGKSQDDRIVS